MAMMVAGTFGSVSPAGAAVVGTGTVTCSNVVSGHVSMFPAWKDTGTGTVTATVSVTLNGCSGGSPVPTSVKVTGTLTFNNGHGRCSGGGAKTAGHLTLAWTATPAVKNSVTLGAVGMSANGTFVYAPFGFTGSYPMSSGGGVFLSGSQKGLCTTGVRGYSVINPFTSVTA
jgi:hypothetical protein